MSTPELPRGPGFENMVEQGLIDPGWAEVLQPEADRIAQLGDFLRAEISAGRGYLPAGTDVFRAFVRPFDAVRVLIVWLYNNTGKCVLAAALFHATVNMAYMFFPVYG